jgi:hypothetical protein
MTNRFDSVDEKVWDLFEETAADAATRSFQFVTPIAPGPDRPLDWRIGDLILDDNQEVLALPDLSVMGWLRYERKKVVEEHWVSQLGNAKPRRPASLTDTAQWETWPDGRPRDPWLFQHRLPLRLVGGPLSDRVVLFNGVNEGSRTAIGAVQVAFAEKRRRPLVRLTSTKRDGGSGFDPVLQIIGWSEDDSPVPGLNLARNSEAATPPPPQANGGGHRDMDDDIPF